MKPLCCQTAEKRSSWKLSYARQDSSQSPVATTSYLLPHSVLSHAWVCAFLFSAVTAITQVTGPSRSKQPPVYRRTVLLHSGPKRASGTALTTGCLGWSATWRGLFAVKQHSCLTNLTLLQIYTIQTNLYLRWKIGSPCKCFLFITAIKKKKVGSPTESFCSWCILTRHCFQIITEILQIDKDSLSKNKNQFPLLWAPPGWLNF